MKAQFARAIIHSSLRIHSRHYSQRKCSGEAFALSNNFSETFNECFGATRYPIFGALVRISPRLIGFPTPESIDS